MNYCGRIRGACFLIDGSPWSGAVVYAKQEAVAGIPTCNQYTTITDEDGGFDLGVQGVGTYICWAESKIAGSELIVSDYTSAIEGGDEIELRVQSNRGVLNLQFRNIDRWERIGIRLFVCVPSLHNDAIGCIYEISQDGSVRGIAVPGWCKACLQKGREVRLLTGLGVYVGYRRVRSDGKDVTRVVAHDELILHGPASVGIKLEGKLGRSLPKIQTYVLYWFIDERWCEVPNLCTEGHLEVLADCDLHRLRGVAPVTLVRCHGYADRLVHTQAIDAKVAVLEPGHELAGRISVGKRSLSGVCLALFSNISDGQGSFGYDFPPLLSFSGKHGEFRIKGRHDHFGHRLCAVLTPSLLRAAFGDQASDVWTIVVLHSGFEQDLGDLDVQEFGVWGVHISNGRGAHILVMEDVELDDERHLPFRPLEARLAKSGQFRMAVNPATHLSILVFGDNGYWMGVIQVGPKQHSLVEVELSAAVIIRGYVCDALRESIQNVGVRVRCIRPEDPQFRSLPRFYWISNKLPDTCFTNENGEFAIAVPVAGLYGVIVPRSREYEVERRVAPGEDCVACHFVIDAPSGV